MRRLVTGAVAVVLVACVVAPAAFGSGSPTPMPLALRFKGTGTYTIHYYISGKQDGGCTEDGGATFNLDWKDRTDWSNFQGGHAAQSGGLTFSIYGPGWIHAKWTLTGGENCSTTEKPTCDTELRLARPFPYISFDVPLDTGGTAQDSFKWPAPFSLDENPGCPMFAAGLPAIPIKLFDQTVASTITADVSLPNSDVVSGKANTKSFGEPSLKGDVADCKSALSALFDGAAKVESCAQTLAWTATTLIQSG
jgi:hypothetical protein